MTDSINDAIRRNGFAFARGVVGAAERVELIAALGPAAAAGRRGVLGVSAVATLARSERILEVVRPHMQGEPFPVRGIFFNKSAGANWLVPWHQDVTVAARERVEADGFGPWSIKNGVPHVQPPAALLEQMIAVRVHLDDADGLNGALRVAPGTHRYGRLAPQEIDGRRAEAGEIICEAQAGDALLMRPLVLHASSRSRSDRPRRVLHIEYAGCALPAGMHWYESA